MKRRFYANPEFELGKKKRKESVQKWRRPYADPTKVSAVGWDPLWELVETTVLKTRKRYDDFNKGVGKKRFIAKTSTLVGTQHQTQPHPTPTPTPTHTHTHTHLFLFHLPQNSKNFNQIHHLFFISLFQCNDGRISTYSHLNNYLLLLFN